MGQPASLACLRTLALTSLLSAACATSGARELDAKDPVRASLISLAREAPVQGLPADARLSFSLAWVNGAQGKVCAAARSANGDLLVQDGRLQLKRVVFQKRGARWAVERAEHLVIGEDQSMPDACGHGAPDPQLATALKELDAHPPTAGIRSAPAAKAVAHAANAPAGTQAQCADAEPKHANPQPSGPGVVSLPGRSLLHFAPDLACFMGKHIVGGDKVQILAHVPGWTRVSYTHPITHVTTQGWVKSERVRLDERSAASL